MDAEGSPHPEANKYQDIVATDDPEGPEYLDADVCCLTEVFRSYI